MPFRPISPAQFIRQHCLRMNVTEFAEALGVSIAVASRYEDEGGRIPDHHHKKILELAKERKVRIKKEWFEAVPWDAKAGVPA